MKRFRWKSLIPAVILSIALPLSVMAAAAAPIISTDWLSQNLKAPNQVIIDIRKVEEYKAGHIPGSISAIYNTWAVKKGDLLNELPPDDDLRDAVGAAGIKPDSTVVIIGKTDTPSDRADITRVAWTLNYAGVQNVSLLSGAINKWVAEKKPVTTELTRTKSSSYTGKFNKNVLTTKDTVMSRLGKALIVDVREPDFFAGKKKLEFVPKMGHIKGAVNLPSSWLYNQDGTYKDKAALESAVAPVVGKDLSREMIIYCDTGKFCTGWWFMLSQVLGYKNVKVYDGSMQEWAKDPNAPIELSK
jgi:thiosulfate/3-mercaptopyruvate sulfurtransferase